MVPHFVSKLLPNHSTTLDFGLCKLKSCHTYSQNAPTYCALPMHGSWEITKQLWHNWCCYSWLKYFPFLAWVGTTCMSIPCISTLEYLKFVVCCESYNHWILHQDSMIGRFFYCGHKFLSKVVAPLGTILFLLLHGTHKLPFECPLLFIGGEVLRASKISSYLTLDSSIQQISLCLQI